MLKSPWFKIALKIIVPGSICLALHFFIIMQNRELMENWAYVALPIFLLWFAVEFFLLQHDWKYLYRIRRRGVPTVEFTYLTPGMSVKNDGIFLVFVSPVVLMLTLLFLLSHFAFNRLMLFFSAFIFGLPALLAVISFRCAPASFKKTGALRKSTRWVALQHGMALFTILGISFIFAQLFRY